VQAAAAGAGGGVGSGGAAATGGAAAAGGAGGGTLGMACTPATTMLAPANGLIADFAGPDGGLEVAGGLFVFPDPGASAPAVSTTGGAFHITESAASTAATQYVGTGLFFNDCIDATAFTGVQFTIGGSFSGCTMQYATADVEHEDATTDAFMATGPAGSYPPQTTLAASGITPTPQTLMMPFTSSTIFGSPQTPIDKTKLVALVWQFTVPTGAPTTADGGTPACVADITIDNVTFY
jgi:hypothetical protein